MPLDVFFRETILDILRSQFANGGLSDELAVELVKQAIAAGLPPGELVKVYRQGFNAALQAVAIAFGVHDTRALVVTVGELGAAGDRQFLENP